MRNIEREAPVLITHAADRDTRSGLVFEFDDLALRRCGVGNEGRKQVACDPVRFRGRTQKYLWPGNRELEGERN